MGVYALRGFPWAEARGCGLKGGFVWVVVRRERFLVRECSVMRLFVMKEIRGFVRKERFFVIMERFVMCLFVMKEMWVFVRNEFVCFFVIIESLLGGYLK